MNRWRHITRFALSLCLVVGCGGGDTTQNGQDTSVVTTDGTGPTDPDIQQPDASGADDITGTKDSASEDGVTSTDASPSPGDADAAQSDDAVGPDTTPDVSDVVQDAASAETSSNDVPTPSADAADSQGDVAFDDVLGSDAVFEDVSTDAPVEDAGPPPGCGDGPACEGVAVCIDGECVCSEIFVLCDDLCVDLDTDPMHCGSCDAPCPLTAACEDGFCVEPVLT
ncbi:MAG: hypothetical protein QF464_20930, partial [Myxococcota bacterium]|nr:hypothetical protein [Myxococcota bacterium]